MTSPASGLFPTTTRKGRSRELAAVVIATGRPESRSMPLTEAAKLPGEERRVPWIGKFRRDGPGGCVIAGARGAALGSASLQGGKRTAVLVEVGVCELIASGKSRKGHLTASLLWTTDGCSLDELWGRTESRLYRNIPVNASNDRSRVAWNGLGQ